MEEATRNLVPYRYDLLPPEALREWAERLSLGAEKYGDDNWKKGLPGPKNPLNHALAHLIAYMRKREGGVGFDELDEDGDTPAQDLGAILCNIGFEYYFRSHPSAYDDNNRLHPPVNAPIPTPEPKLNIFQEILNRVGGMSEAGRLSLGAK